MNGVAPGADSVRDRSARPRSRAAQSDRRPPLARAWYETNRFAAVLGFSLAHGLRVTGRENIPRSGGGLVLSNHLSFLDVYAIGMGIPRPLSYVARSGLFVPGLGAYIRSIGAYPIERDGAGVSGMKETLRRLRAGSLVVIFPEGTRSLDGELGPIKPGIAALARSGVPFLPAAIAGTFESLPRGVLWPRPYPLWTHYGPLIPAAELAMLAPDAIQELVRERILDCQRHARAGVARILDRQDAGLAGTG